MAQAPARPRLCRPQPPPLLFLPALFLGLPVALVLAAAFPGGAVAQMHPVFSPGEQVRIGAFIQPAYRYQGIEGEEDRTGFFLRRARIDVTGQLLEGRVRFRLMPDLADISSPRDAWMELRGPTGLALRMGQQIVPHHLQRERSMGRAHFGDRALAVRRFELSGGRDLGAVAHWTDPGGRAFAAAGVFNGRGMNRPEPTAAPLLSGRAGVSLGGPPAGSETDLARSPEPVVTLSGGTLSARRSLLRPRPGFAPDAAADWWNWTADLHARWRGVSLVAAWFDQHVSPEGDPAPPTIRGEGWYLSGGWVLPGHDVEVAFRHSEATWDRAREGTPTRESGAGVTFFHRGHELQTRIQFHRTRTPPGSGIPSARVLTLEHQLLLGG